jgi:anaerobic C4-dicarboxylate transporter DcuA
MIWVQLILVLLAIFLGTRLQGISLGIMGGLALAILAFIFHVKPTDPPTEVLMIVTAVVTASSTLGAAGGLRYLTTLAERFIRQYPHRITFVSPLIVYLFTLLGGTGHIIYAILPVIASVAKDVGVRPSRPLSVSVIAAQQAVLASPISAPIALVVGLLAPYGIGLIDILKVCVPATFGGVVLATLVVDKWGKELHEDPSYLQRVQGAQQKMEEQVAETDPIPSAAKLSVVLFTLGITIIILCGVWKGLRPSWEIDGTIQPMAMPVVIEIMMLAIAALIVLLCKVNPKEIVKSNVFSSGIQAVIAILGISWLGDTFIAANKAEILAAVQAQITQAPWQFSLLLFLMSILLVSQTATVRAIMPLGIALGLPATVLLAALPAVNGLFFIPNYPTQLAAISLDSTGTTRVGKFVLNHSFMLPGLVATTTAVGIAGLLVKLFF